MPISFCTLPADLATYDRWLKSHPQGNLWQSLEWKKYQESLGRTVRIYMQYVPKQITASALVIIDRTTGGFSTWDISRGPLSLSPENEATLMERIIADAKKDKCLSVYASPITPLSALDVRFSVHASTRCEQSPATRILNLTPGEEGILTQMHQKGRYNIKVAQRHGVTIRQGTAKDIDAFYGLLQSTSKRDVFHISQKSHYTRFLTDLESSFFLIAIHDGKPVAGLLGVRWNGTGFYYYGASDHSQRALMAPYLLQWEAMKECKVRGCKDYDLLGIAPPESGEDHHWGGISAFKEKFGGRVVVFPSEQEIILKPLAFSLLKLKRKILG